MSSRQEILVAGASAVVGGGVLAGLPAAAAPSGAGGPVRWRSATAGRRATGPEHTLASYELAARLDADVIQPDLLATRDHILVARHEPEISGTTDVSIRAEFAARQRTSIVDGVAVTGWFVEDFTLAEIKTLRAVERLPLVRQHNTLYDGLFEVPTLEEILRLRTRLSREPRRPLGVYPETRHPTYHRSLGLALEEPLVATLRRFDLDHRDAPVFVQSFEAANLRDLRRRLGLRAPTPPACGYIRTRSAPRTSSCRRTCGSDPIRPPTGGPSTSTSRSSPPASTARSPTSPTSASWPDRCTRRRK